MKGHSIPIWERPIFVSRVGIDLNPVDLSNEDEIRWAKSLIWPDQTERLERFERAIKLLHTTPVSLQKGSALDRLLPIVLSTEPGSHICVLHSFTLNQFSQIERAQFDALLEEASETHRIDRVSLEWFDSEVPELVVATYRNGKKRTQEKLADCHQHGLWIHWISN
jgi:hypothetical protein